MIVMSVMPRLLLTTFMYDDCKLWKVALWCLWERSTGKLCSVHSM